MQLSDKDILKAIELGEIESENFDYRNLQPASYDLTLGHVILRRKRSWLNRLLPWLFPLPVVRLVATNHHGGFRVDRGGDDFEAIDLKSLDHYLDAFVLMPGDFVLGSSAEVIGPKSIDLVANFQDKSTLARLGISTFFGSGLIDPGNVGRWTFEIKNNGHEPIPLYAGMAIAQLTFTRLESPASKGYSGKYQNPGTVGMAK